MRLRTLGLLVTLALGLVLMPLQGDAQTRVHRVGVMIHGGPYYVVVEGLRQGLRDLGFEEGKRILLDIRDSRGDLKEVEKAARDLSNAKVDLLYTFAASVTRRAAEATVDIPIVFAVGTDPVWHGFVQSLAKPGGRLTGVHFLATDLTAKRMEILKELVPKVRRVVTFYDPGNRSANESATLGREAAKQLGITFVERHVASVDELRRALDTLKPNEMDAYLFVADAMVGSHAQMVIDTARAKRLPTIFSEGTLVAQGALTSYGHNFHEVGRISARYVARVLTGTHPRSLPVERISRLELVVNLKTAKALGLTIPPSVLVRADQVIE